MQYMTDNHGTNKIADEAFKQLSIGVPEQYLDFNGTEYSQPAALAYFGQKTDREFIIGKVKELENSSPAEKCELAMVMAEAIEASMGDHEQYFITDQQTRNWVFFGSKWKSGWVFIIGNKNHSKLAREFINRDFLVFAQNGIGLEGVIDLGPRETAAVYFLQLMVRYAMIWGAITPGDDHEMSHFLEKDLPGVVVADGELTSIEKLLLLGLMKMGAPAVVPDTYPWDLGRQIQVKGIKGIVEAAIKFPNLRVKDIQGKIIELPVFCNKLNITQEFETKLTIGGRDSFFALMPGDVKDGILLPENIDLSTCNKVGILIEIGDKRLDVSVSDYIEKTAHKGISSIDGIEAESSDKDGFLIKLAEGIKPDASMIAEALQKWISFEFPYIENINIKILTDNSVDEVRDMVEAYKAKRREIIASESDDNVEYFHYCLECQPFSKDHVCIVTPDHPPICGKDRLLAKAAALFGVSWHPWKRRDLEGQDIRGTIKVESIIDPIRGEYESVNNAMQKLSPGGISRVHLHGLREFPHTSCGCFQYIVFWIESLDGFGIIERNYRKVAPEDLTWNKLANAAGGKQTPGVAGISGNYLQSKRFMQGEGGLTSLRWISPKAYEILKDLLPDNDNLIIGQ